MKNIEDITPELEPILDSSKLELVIRALAEICQAKAEHVRSNWQDESLAAFWEGAAKKLDGVSINYYITRVP
jgi:hypothetical protein